jgi:hypothetical protein
VVCAVEMALLQLAAQSMELPLHIAAARLCHPAATSSGHTPHTSDTSPPDALAAEAGGARREAAAEVAASCRRDGSVELRSAQQQPSCRVSVCSHVALNALLVRSEKGRMQKEEEEDVVEGEAEEAEEAADVDGSGSGSGCEGGRGGARGKREELTRSKSTWGGCGVVKIKGGGARPVLQEAKRVKAIIGACVCVCVWCACLRACLRASASASACVCVCVYVCMYIYCKCA